MRFAWISAVKDLRRFRRDIPALASWLLLPLVIGGLIGLVFGRQDANPHGLLLIDDEDHGLAGPFVREIISRSSLGRLMAIQQADRDEGRERMNHGDASALLIIPQGFDLAVRLDQPAELTLVTNPEERIMPQLAREAASATVDAAVWLQQSGGTDLVGATRAIGRANRYLNPPRIALKTTVIAPPGIPRTAADLLFPGTVFLVVLIVAQGMSVEIWKERAAGAVGRLLGTPAAISLFLAGKLAATSAVFTAALAISFAAAHFLFRVPVRSPALALAWTVCCAVVFYLGLLIVQMIAANERMALVVANMIVIPLAMLGGSFFPVEIMPETFARVARAVPNGWMLMEFKSIVTGNAGGAMFYPFAVLLAAMIVEYAVAARLLRRLAR
jgi:hypothetical protein